MFVNYIRNTKNESLSLLIGKSMLYSRSYKGERVMTVVNVNDLSIFKSRNTIDNDENWAIKLMNECEQESTHNKLHLQDEKIYVENHSVTHASSTLNHSQKTGATVENRCTPSAIEIQILAAEKTKQHHQEKAPLKSKKSLRTLFRNK